ARAAAGVAVRERVLARGALESAGLRARDERRVAELPHAGGADADPDGVSALRALDDLERVAAPERRESRLPRGQRGGGGGRARRRRRARGTRRACRSTTSACTPGATRRRRRCSCTPRLRTSLARCTWARGRPFRRPGPAPSTRSAPRDGEGAPSFDWPRNAS